MISTENVLSLLEVNPSKLNEKSLNKFFFYFFSSIGHNISIKINDKNIANQKAVKIIKINFHIVFKIRLSNSSDVSLLIVFGIGSIG